MPRMPRAGFIWLHVVLSTRGSWLPGDPRGWRSRGHKRHSSGDYHHPPPAGEHAGLLGYVRQRATATIIIPATHRQRVGETLLDHLQRHHCRCLTLSVSATHVHLLVEMPRDLSEQRHIMGRCKNYASTALRRVLPGTVWAAGGKFKPIRDQSHQIRAYRYILAHHKQGAWVWDYQEAEEIPSG